MSLGAVDFLVRHLWQGWLGPVIPRKDTSARSPKLYIKGCKDHRVQPQ
jgi:hypothetical protein